MAQTKKKRRRKRRGTQSGRINTGRGPRPRSRQEAQARARSRKKGAKGGRSRQPAHRHDQEPTWRGAFIRGAVASGLFVVIVVLLFRRPVAPALGLGVLMLAFYVPMGYYIDRYFYARRQRAAQKEREASNKE